MILFCVMPLMGCSKDDTSSQVIRIHIRANSNSNVDQDIKLVVRDEILKYVTPLIAKCKDSSDVKNVLTNNALKIDKIANSVLEQNGFDYTAKSKITNEYFPSRSYNGKIFKLYNKYRNGKSCTWCDFMLFFTFTTNFSKRNWKNN